MNGCCWKQICKSTFCGLGCDCSYWKVQYLGHVEETRLWPGTLLSANTSWNTFSRAISVALPLSAQKNRNHMGTRPKGNWGQGMNIVKRNVVHLTWTSLSLFPLPEVNQAIKEKMIGTVFLFSWRETMIDSHLLQRFHCRCLLCVLLLSPCLPHLRFATIDFPTNTASLALPKALSSYWETPPLKRRCCWVNEG